MNSSQAKHSHDRSRGPEETLRLLANLPAPDGISARVQASLRTAPRRSSLFDFGNVFGLSGWINSAALRTAAAAGIVCVVAGGGWQIYSHVQTSAGMQGVAVPVRVSPVTGSEGGFSTSGAIAKPDPLKAPVITHQVQDSSQTSLQSAPAKTKPKIKPDTRSAPPQSPR